VPTDLFSDNYGAMSASSHIDNISSLTINLERISTSSRRRKRWYVYLTFMKTIVARMCKSGQVAMDYLLIETIETLGKQMFLLWKQRARRTKLTKLLHPKNGKNFVFALVHHRPRVRDWLQPLGLSVQAFNLRTGPQNGVSKVKLSLCLTN
jgi:hypothetical protein